jgi:hypothetical protein
MAVGRALIYDRQKDSYVGIHIVFKAVAAKTSRID